MKEDKKALLEEARHKGRHQVRKIEIYLRRARSLELRRMGYDFHAVARIMKEEVANRTRDLPSQLDEDLIPQELPGKYGWQTAKLDVERILETLGPTVTENVSQVMELELSRLDELTTAFYPAALSGSSKAAEMIVKFMDRRAKYRGLYAPDVIQIEDWRTEIIALIRSGGIPTQQVINEFGATLAQELYLEAGTPLDKSAIQSPETGRFISSEEANDLDFLKGEIVDLDFIEEVDHGTE